MTVGRTLVFGYGTLLNDESREREGGVQSRDVCALADLTPEFGFSRSFCMRSSTGFTALGLVRDGNPRYNCCGVVFEVCESSLKDYDLRESGYYRELIPHPCLTLLKGSLKLQKNDLVYTYIPNVESIFEATEDFPILQTYVDVCLGGCMEWGGVDLIKEFVLSTQMWSSHFLNDPPMSRRPWLHRPHYLVIDQVLDELKDHTFFHFRKHTEEYSSQSISTKYSGLWGCNAKNTQFVGRTNQLEYIHDSLVTDGMVEITGLGGMGKSTLATEYCQRYYQSFYHLVIQIRAESKASITADIRKFILDQGDGDGDDQQEANADKILEEFKRSLAKLRSNYLVVFDNIENDEPPIQPAMPFGHILVTRRVAARFMHQGKTLRLEEFKPNESLSYLEKSLQLDFHSHSHQNVTSSVHDLKVAKSESCQEKENEEELAALRAVTERLEHHPLALAQASAYMMRVDISAAEYLSRFKTGGGDAMQRSLAMAIARIEKESPSALKVLMRLAFLNSDWIKKNLVQKILETAHYHRGPQAIATAVDPEGTETVNANVGKFNNWLWTSARGGVSLLVAATAAAGATGVLLVQRKRPSGTGIAGIIAPYLVGGCTIVAGGVGAYLCTTGYTNAANTALEVEKEKEKGSFSLMKSSNEDESLLEADRVWEVLKQFSLLSVRGSRKCRIASIHRMQQQFLRLRGLRGDTEKEDEGVEGDRPMASLCVEQCVWVFKQLWTYNSSLPSTWESASELVEHIETLCSHFDTALNDALECNSFLVNMRSDSFVRFSDLLVSAADYYTLVLSRFDTAENFLKVSAQLQSYEGESEIVLKARTYHQRGAIDRLLGNFDSSMKHLQIALDLRKRIAGQDILIADTLHEMGILEMRLSNNEGARERLQESLKIKQRFQYDPAGSSSHHLYGDQAKTTISSTLHQLAINMINMKQYDKAEELLKQALSLDKAAAAAAAGSGDNNNKKFVSLAAATQQLGRVYLRRGQLQDAKKCCQESLGMYVNMGYGCLEDYSPVLLLSYSISSGAIILYDNISIAQQHHTNNNPFFNP